jgi:broad specificity phosphatase PhoE
MNSTGVLYLIRHGQTDGNGHHYVGRQDLVLNAAGRVQAVQVALALAATPLDAIYASPLQRAALTAKTLARGRVARDGSALAVQLRPELMEIHYGEFQGRSKHDCPLRLKSTYSHERMPGGESLADVHARVVSIAPEFVERVRGGESLAVVGHYRSNQLLCAHLTGRSFSEALNDSSYRPRNGNVLRLVLAGPASRDGSQHCQALPFEPEARFAPVSRIEQFSRSEA